MTDEVFGRLLPLFVQLSNLTITAEGKEFVADKVEKSVNEIDAHVEAHRADYDADTINKLIGLRSGFERISLDWSLGLTLPPAPERAAQPRPNAKP